MGGQWLGEWAQSAHYTSQSQVSLSHDVTGNLRHHSHSKLGIVLFSCPHYLAWVWATYNLSILSFPALGTHANSPVFLAVSQKDFGTQIALSGSPGNFRFLVLFPTWLRGLSTGLVPTLHLSPFIVVDLTCWGGGLSTFLIPPSRIPTLTPTIGVGNNYFQSTSVTTWKPRISWSRVVVF